MNKKTVFHGFGVLCLLLMSAVTLGAVHEVKER